MFNTYYLRRAESQRDASLDSHRDSSCRDSYSPAFQSFGRLALTSFVQRLMTLQYEIFGLARLFHSDLLRRPGSQMDAALISKSSSGSVYTHSRRQTSSLALPHQLSQPPRHDQYEIFGLVLTCLVWLLNLVFLHNALSHESNLDLSNLSYSSFLNAVAQNDFNNLYAASMEDVIRMGNPGEYYYLLSRSANNSRSIPFVDRTSASYYSHWLQNISSLKRADQTLQEHKAEWRESKIITEERNQNEDSPFLEDGSGTDFIDFISENHAACCDPYLKSNIITFHAVASSCTASMGLEEAAGASFEWIGLFLMGIFYSPRRALILNENEHLLVHREEERVMGNASSKTDLYASLVLGKGNDMYGSIEKTSIDHRGDEHRLYSLSSPNTKNAPRGLGSSNNRFAGTKIEPAETTPLLDSIKKGGVITADETPSPKKKFSSVRPFVGAGLRKSYSFEGTAAEVTERTSLLKKSQEKLPLDGNSFKEKFEISKAVSDFTHCEREYLVALQVARKVSTSEASMAYGEVITKAEDLRVSCNKVIALRSKIENYQGFPEQKKEWSEMLHAIENCRSKIGPQIGIYRQLMETYQKPYYRDF